MASNKLPQGPRTLSFSQYTPLNANQAPCRYHHNYDHSTEEHHTLKDKIEKLIQAKHFKKIVKEADIGQGGHNYHRGDDMLRR